MKKNILFLSLILLLEGCPLFTLQPLPIKTIEPIKTSIPVPDKTPDLPEN